MERTAPRRGRTAPSPGAREQPGPAVSVGGISDAAKHRHAREEKLRRHLASEQPRIGLFDHGMVWGVGSDDPSSETAAEQRDLVADDVRHDPVPGTLPGQDRAVRTGRADEFYRRPGPPGLS